MSLGGYQFGPFRFDARERLLYRGADQVLLTPKAADTLYHLLLRHGSLVEKSELMQLVWPESFVEETTLAQNIFTLRKLLGDEDQSIIETVPRRGYRFAVPVSEVPDRGTPVSAATRPRTIVIAIAIAAVAAVALAVWLSWLRIQHQRQIVSTLAVLPFHPIGDQQDEYLGVAMADALISRLSNIRGVSVRPTSAVRKFTASSDPILAARELAVGSVLEGTIQRAGDTMRVTVQLVDAERDAPLWSDKFDVAVSDVFSLQDRISDEVARALIVNLGGHPRRYTENADAHRDYLRGRYFWNKRTADGYVHAIECFETAIRRDPAYALAYAGLADSYALLGAMTNRVAPRGVLLPKALRAAQHALEIDPTLAEAHASLGFIKMHYQWDWAGGEREFRRAIELNPGYATAHHWYSYELTALRRFDEAVYEIREAQKADPVSLIINTDVAEILMFAGRTDEALAQCRRTLELDPNFPLAYWVLTRTYHAKGMSIEAISTAKKFLELDPGRDNGLIDLAAAYRLAGQVAESNRTLDEWHRRSKGKYVLIYDGVWAAVIRGDREQSIALLEDSYREHSGSLILLNVDIFPDSLRNDPRFKNLVHRMGLDQSPRKESAPSHTAL
jgi:DNA-binding winged helix-turn-helix (wHTH) protein/TolB-like protein/Tfp pilus assembly protein PilF